MVSVYLNSAPLRSTVGVNDLRVMANEWRIDLLPNFYTNGKPVGQPTPLKHLELINKSCLISSAQRNREYTVKWPF